ncbi:hypothetical protein BBJ28_00013638 [Nothophytophthora sp. Chile5]|nr:hypothetical protein BBJ28_00013638 [Nothophytophthora sp. Chile5]
MLCVRCSFLTVSKTFRDAGAVIVDADVVAREVVLPGRGAYKEIVRCFGPDVLNEDDATINRAKLGAIIFSDPAQRKKLNAATHKYIIWEMFKQLVYQRLVCRKRLVVFDAPLLLETKLLEHFCYPIIVVACSETNELARLMKRDNMAQEDAEKRIKAQMKLHEKRERVLKIYHDSKDVFNLKEVEKLGSKAGVVLQTVKDVNQALVDDALVDCDKIGSGNYFWSFPSKLSQSRRRKLVELEQRQRATQEKLDRVTRSINEQKELRTESKLRRLTEQRAKVEALRSKVQHLAENDPEILGQLERKARWLGIKDDFDYVA